ncbi:Peptidase S41 family protein ustP [Colletotrichum sp. SAR 10_76]|nr:Peptidase S41 family protein ustP [Colletotrichum sp. SAR 10_76]
MRTAIWFWWTLAYAVLAIAGLLPRRTFSFLNDDTFAIEDSGKAFVASSAPEGACAMVQPAVNKFLQDKPKAVDIEGGFQSIGDKVANNKYQSEYDFQLDILDLISSAHDGHFVFRGDMFKTFSFRNGLVTDVVSISRDGVEVPKLYHLKQLRQNASAPAITKINGKDANVFISDLNLKYSGLQDPDSQWNSQFNSYATKQNSMILAASPIFQGPMLTLTYENGEERSEESVAVIRPGTNFTDIKNGEDYYNKFCNPVMVSTNVLSEASNIRTQSRAKSPMALSPSVAPIDGYPVPEVRDKGINATAGYFLNGTGYDDVAVLAVSSFAPPETVDSFAYLNDFQQTVEKFLAASQKAGKKKLVIDVTANGGGFILAGFDLFAQLFPTVSRFQANNLRLPSSVNTLARLAAAIPADFKPKTPEENKALGNLRGSPILSNLLPKGVFTPDRVAFTSLEQVLRPVVLNGDNFSAYQQIPMDQPDPLFNLTGTGPRTNPPASVFTPENIVLLTDGTCVEGAQLFSYNDITIDATSALLLAPENQKAELQNGDLGELAKAYAIKRAANPKAAGAVNGKNAFAMSNATVPLQFLWEPANCRLFYTLETLTQPEAAWKRVVDVTFNNRPQLCVADSIVPAAKPATVDPFFQQSAKDLGLSKGG